MRKIYVCTTPHCKKCKGVKSDLTELGYGFTEIDVENDEEDMALDYNITSTPHVIILDGGRECWRAQGTLSGRQIEAMNRALMGG